MELPERFAAGDPEAFEASFRQYQGEVYRWIVRIVRDPGAAEDLTIETFWRVYRARAHFDPARSFPAWVRQVATRAALSRLKTVHSEVRLPQNWPDTPSPNPAAGRELHEAIQRAFRALPAKLRVVATLALIEETPGALIAEALGILLAAVKTREFRAVRLLRKKLKRLGVEP